MMLQALYKHLTNILQTIVPSILHPSMNFTHGYNPLCSSRNTLLVGLYSKARLSDSLYPTTP